MDNNEWNDENVLDLFAKIEELKDSYKAGRIDSIRAIDRIIARATETQFQHKFD